MPPPILSRTNQAHNADVRYCGAFTFTEETTQTGRERAEELFALFLLAKFALEFAFQLVLVGFRLTLEFAFEFTLQLGLLLVGFEFALAFQFVLQLVLVSLEFSLAREFVFEFALQFALQFMFQVALHCGLRSLVSLQLAF